MSEEENQRKNQNSQSQNVAKWVRYFFASIGLLASFVGIALVILAYLVLSPQIATTQGLLNKQIDNAMSGVGHLDKSLEGTQESLGEVPKLSEGLSSGFEGYAASTHSLADGIDVIADEMELLYGADKTLALKSAASNLRSSAYTLEGQSRKILEFSTSLDSSIASMGDARKDLSKAKSDLSNAKKDVSGIFDSISTALIIGCAMFALVFISLGAYSVALFL
ncbi:MAG: hypothetical protein ABIG39_01905 [Candidatus Micrarchaeota archaeon]